MNAESLQPREPLKALVSADSELTFGQARRVPANAASSDAQRESRAAKIEV